MSATVDDAEIRAYQDEIGKLAEAIRQRDERIQKLEEARSTAIVYARKLGFLCSTLTEESHDLNMAVDAIQHVLNSV